MTKVDHSHSPILDSLSLVNLLLFKYFHLFYSTFNAILRIKEGTSNLNIKFVLIDFTFHFLLKISHLLELCFFYLKYSVVSGARNEQWLLKR